MDPQLGFSLGSTVCPGLSKLIEECGEVLQIAGKLIAIGGKPDHWDGSNLKTRIEEEIADLSAALNIFIYENGLDCYAIMVRKDEKTKLFRRWYQDQLAAATTPPENPG